VTLSVLSPGRGRENLFYSNSYGSGPGLHASILEFSHFLLSYSPRFQGQLVPGRQSSGFKESPVALGREPWI
jgi:hypothetical protein